MRGVVLLPPERDVVLLPRGASLEQTRSYSEYGILVASLGSTESYLLVPSTGTTRECSEGLENEVDPVCGVVLLPAACDVVLLPPGDSFAQTGGS